MKSRREKIGWDVAGPASVCALMFCGLLIAGVLGAQKDQRIWNARSDARGHIVYDQRGRCVDYIDDDGKLQTVTLGTPAVREARDGGDHYLPAANRPALTMIRGYDLSAPTITTYQ